MHFRANLHDITRYSYSHFYIQTHETIRQTIGRTFAMLPQPNYSGDIPPDSAPMPINLSWELCRHFNALWKKITCSREKASVSDFAR